MASIEQILNGLQPYVIGIRFLDGTPIVDTVFKDGWTIPEDTNIKRIKGNDELNYYMIFSEVDGVGLNDLLSYVERTIKHNQDREKKHELLRKKVNELKDIFQKTSLTKLATLKFVLGEEDLIPKLDEFDIETEQIDSPQLSVVEVTQTKQQPAVQYLDEDHNPIELTDEDRELQEEEERAERNRQLIGNKKPFTNVNKIELPPKAKIQVAVTNDGFDTDCECGPDAACDKCIDQKGL